MIIYFDKAIIGDIALRVIDKEGDTTWMVQRLDSVYEKDKEGRDTKVVLKDSTGKPKVGLKLIEIPRDIIMLDGTKRFPYN